METIDCRTTIDGRRAVEINFSVVPRFVDQIVALSDRQIFDAMPWIMERRKLVAGGATAAPVGRCSTAGVAGAWLPRRRSPLRRQRESRSVAAADLELLCRCHFHEEFQRHI